MALVARALEYEEWHKCPTYMDPVLVNMKPGASRVCVVENEQGEIVARWMLYPMLMAEDLWVHPDYRQRVSVGRKLWRLMHRCAGELGFARVVSAIVDDDTKGYLSHRRLEAEELPLMVTYPVRGQ